MTAHERLDDIEPKAIAAYEDVRAIAENVARIDVRLDRHSNQLSDLQKTQQQHGDQLTHILKIQQAHGTKIDRIERHTAQLASTLSRTQLAVGVLEVRLNEHTERFVAIDGRLDGVDGRLDGIDRRLDGVDGRLDGIDGRLDGMAGTLQEILGRLPNRQG